MASDPPIDPKAPERRAPTLDDFLVEPTRDLTDW